MESKLAILKDAWNEFLLDETISNAAKGVVDLATSFLNLINKLNDLPGALGTASKALVGFGVFKGGKKIVNIFSDAIKSGQITAKAATEAGESYSVAFEKKVKESLKGSFGKTFDEIKNKTKKTFTKSTWTTPFPSKLPDLKKDMGFKSIEEYQKKIKDLKERQNNLLNSETLQFNPRGLQQIDEYQKQIDGLSASMEAAEKASSASLAQRNLYQTAVQNGMSIDQAKILLAREATAEEYKEIAAKVLGEKATKAEIDAKAEELAAEYALNSAQQIGLLTQIRYTAAALFGSKATRADAVAKLLQANNTWLAKKANDGLNASLLASPIGWFAVGIAAVTAALVGMGVALYNASSNVQADKAFKKAEEAAEATSKAIDLVKQSYEDLSNSQNTYNDLQNTLENLVVGTDEWKDKLVEANQQVLELLKTYPKLAKYVSIGENGEYQISSTGWENVKKEQEKSLNIATGAQILASNSVAEAEKQVIKVKYASKDDVSNYTSSWLDIIFEAFLRQASSGYMGSNSSYIDEAFADPIFDKLEQYKENNEQNYLEAISGDQQALEQMASELNSKYGVAVELQTDTLKNIIEDYEDFSEEISEQNEKIKSGDTLFKSAVADATTISEEFASGIVNGVLAGFDDNDIQNKKNELKSKSEDEIYSILEETLNLSKEQIKETYGDLDTDALKDLAANLLLVKDQADKADNAFKKMSKGLGTNSEDMKNLTALMSENGKQLTQDIIDDFNSLKDSDFDDLVTKMGLEDKDSLAALFGFETFDSFQNYLNSNVDKAKELLSNSQDEINSILKGPSEYLGGSSVKIQNPFTDNNDSYKSLIETMDLGNQTAFNQRLVAIATEMGQTGVDKFLDVLSTTYGDLNERSQKILASMASTIDLEDIQTMDDFINVLEDLGINVQDLSDDTLKKLNGQIQALAATSKRTIIDLDKAESKLESLKSAKDIVEKAADNKTTTYSEEDFATLKSAGISMDDFFYNGETYQYLGNTVDLLKQIQTDTNSIRQKMYEQTKKDVEQGAKIADWINNGNSEYSLTKNSDAVSSESLLNALIKGDTVYNAKGTALSKEEQDNLTKEVLEKLIGSVEFDKMGGDTMSGEFAQSLLKQIYESTYGIGGTEYQNNLSDYSNAIQLLSDPLAAQASATQNAKDMVAYDAELDALSKKNKLTEEEAVREKELRALYNSSSKALKAKAAALKIEDEELKDKTDTEKAAIIEEKQLAWNIEKTKEETEDLFDVLADDSGASDTQKDNALSEIVDAANRYLDLDLSKEFLKEGNNLKEFQKAISGTKEEFNSWLASLKQDDLKKALGFTFDNEGFIKAFTEAGIEIQNKKDEIQNALKENPITVDAETGKLDFTRLFSAIAAIVGSAQQALEVIKAVAGSEVSFDISYKSTAFNSEKEASAAAELFETGAYFKAGDKWYANTPQLKGKYTGSSVANNYSPSTKSPSGGGGSSGSDKEYESDYDKYYNLLKKIERVQENRNKLQDEYSKMLDDEDESYGAIANKQSSILSNLKNEVDYQKQLAAGRLSQINQLQAENSDLTGYASYDQNLNKVQIDYEAIITVKDSDVGERIDEYISDLETWADSYTSAQESIIELQKEINDLIEEGTIDLDKSFNILEEIEKVQNEIKNLESELEYRENTAATDPQALKDLYSELDEKYKKQIEDNEYRLTQRKSQYNEETQKAADLGYDKFFKELSDGQFEVDWNALSGENQDIKDKVLEELNNLNELGDAVQEAEEALWDSKKAQQDFYQKLKDSKDEFFNKVKEAVINEKQEQIDKLTEINDSINNTNENILYAISESIERQRQERENEKTEQNLSDMQNQLAFLKMDTSGANQVQILELQKSIDEQTEDHTDTLIDQRISELEDQNSKAFEQRQVQIQLMQDALNEYSKSEQINEDVKEIIEKGMHDDGSVKLGSDLDNLIKNWQDGMSDREKDEDNKNNNQGTASTSSIAGDGIISTPSGVGKGANKSLPSLGQIGKYSSAASSIQKATENNAKTGATTASTSDIVHSTTEDPDSSQAYAKGVDKNGNTTAKIQKMENVGFDTDGSVVVKPTTKTAQYKAGEARDALRIAAKLDSPDNYSADYLEYLDVTDKKGDGPPDGKITAQDARYILRQAVGLERGTYGAADLEIAAILTQTDEGRKWMENGAVTYDDFGCYDFTGDGKLDEQDLQYLSLAAEKDYQISRLTANDSKDKRAAVRQEIIDLATAKTQSTGTDTAYSYNSALAALVTKESADKLRYANAINDFDMIGRTNILEKYGVNASEALPKKYRNDLIENIIPASGKLWSWQDVQNLKKYISTGDFSFRYEFEKDGRLDERDVEKLISLIGKEKKFEEGKRPYPKFKTGGLANFTGPAWLDGTASKPELVLNQRDTENFIQLKDILSSVLHNINSQPSTKTGDTYYEIHIEVDKLDSDYSVDDVANRVKQIIATDANYRNVNLINNLR